MKKETEIRLSIYAGICITMALILFDTMLVYCAVDDGGFETTMMAISSVFAAIAVEINYWKNFAKRLLDY